MSEIHVIAAEDMLEARLDIDAAFRTPKARDAGITLDWIYPTLGDTVNALQEFAHGRKVIDCLLLDGTLDIATPPPEYFDTGQNLSIIRGKKGVFGLGKTKDQNPNLIPLDFMKKDMSAGSDARKVMELIEQMRKRGLPGWQNLAVVGNSMDPMDHILRGTGLAVDFDLQKGMQPPDKVVEAVINAIRQRRGTV